MSISATGAGGGISSSLVPSDAHHCQILVDFIDDKDAFVESHHREIGAHVLSSVGEVRKLATSTLSLVDSVEAMEEVKNIATACRTFMRNYDAGDDQRVMSSSLAAMRAEAGGSVAFLVRILGLRPTSRFDVTAFEPRATEILEGWLDRAV